METVKSDKEIIQQFINTLANEVKGALPKSTGKTANQITTEVTDSSGSIFAPPWISIFQDGRKPGRMPPINPILAWIEARGLQGKNKLGKAMTARSLAFAIAMNMKLRGNTLYRALHGGQIAYSPIRVEFDKIFSKQRIDSLVNVFAGKYQSIIESEILSIK